MAGTRPAAADPVRADHKQILEMRYLTRYASATIILTAFLAVSAGAQSLTREIKTTIGGRVEIVNPAGRVYVNAVPVEDTEQSDQKITLEVASPGSVGEDDLKVTEGANARIEVPTTSARKRIDLSLQVPERTSVRITTGGGEVRLSGDLDMVQVATETGTIATNIPTDDVRYSLWWTESRPRYLADFEVEKVREHSAGRFELKGRFSSTGKYNKDKKKGKDEPGDDRAEAEASPEESGTTAGG